MYTISKTFTFDAAHQLAHLPPGHKCARLHGHTYRVKLTLQAEDLDANGFVVDFTDLVEFKVYIQEYLDHRNLNDVCPYRTTAENLACWLFDVCGDKWPQLVAVAVSETPNTWAEYRP